MNKIQNITGSQVAQDFADFNFYAYQSPEHEAVWNAANAAALELDNLLYYGGSDEEAVVIVERYNLLLEQARDLCEHPLREAPEFPVYYDAQGREHAEF